MVELQQFHRLDDDYDRIDRVDVPTLDTGRRIGLAEVELGFTEQQARCEAAGACVASPTSSSTSTSACCVRCAPTCARST